MAALALESRADVRLVGEVRELRQLVHAHPRDRFLLRVVLGELLDLGLVRRGDLVAAHAALDRGKPGVLRASRVAVTVLAIDLVGADVNAVREVDGLNRRFRGGWRLHDEIARKTRTARSAAPSAPTPAFAIIDSRSPSGGFLDCS